MSTFEISINLDKKCKRCGKPGAGPGGICLGCVADGIKNGEFDDIIKPIKDATQPPTHRSKRQ